jgi:hypothetical protein
MFEKATRCFHLSSASESAHWDARFLHTEEMQQMFGEAIDHYLAVLALSPGSRNAEDNIAVARRNLLFRAGARVAEKTAPNDAAGRKRKVWRENIISLSIRLL